MTRRLVLTGFAAAIVAVFVFHPAPFRQPQAYHHFADMRAWAGIPNTLNVVSNIGFLAVFVAWLLARTQRSVAEWTFFLGVFLTSIGSSLYHLHPSNTTLPWDRLGMAIAFMALLAILIRAPLAWLAAFEAFGIAAVIVSGVYDDLRLYGVAQFYPVLVLLIFIEGWLWAAAAAYAIAKLCEQFDRQIFDALHHTVSGHTLKHLFAAAGIYFIWRWLRRR
ncbi:MAG TPA: alkaline phytoceramidase [Thermoanaerobaculia bacterium]|nr:alkaline phytoceramidase [Thermoanaerobaculia bacterium]